MEKGEVLHFNGEDFLLVENQIVEESKKKTVTILLNVFAIIGIIPLFVLHFVLTVPNAISIEIVDLLYFLFVYLGFFVYIVIHELLHGAAFHFFGKVEKKDIKFGVVWKSAMAYCISTVPVSVKASRLSLMMPVYVVCIPMYIIGIVLNIQVLCIGSILYLSGSVGDFYYMWKLRKAKKDQYMMEIIPTKSGYEIGYLLMEKK